MTITLQASCGHFKPAMLFLAGISVREISFNVIDDNGTLRRGGEKKETEIEKISSNISADKAQIKWSSCFDALF